MRRFLKNKNSLRHVAVILIAATVMTGGAYTVATRAVEHIARKNSEAAALEWARFISGRMPDMKPLLAGEKPTEAAQDFLRTAISAGAPFRFKLFDADGVLRLVSDERWTPRESATSLVEHNTKAAAVVASGAPYFQLKQGDRIKRPAWYSETYTPLMRRGAVIGVAEVYVDETAQIGILSSEVARIAAQIAGVVFLAFAAPGAAYLFRSRQLRRAVDQLAHVERFDDLTGALNRATFVEAVEERLRGDHGVALLLIDLDRFKDVNDTAGQEAGDNILRRAARRLRSVVGEEACVARLDGDEFAICAHCTATDGPMDADAAAEIAQQVVAALAKPFQIDDRLVRIGGSVGYALRGSDGANAAELQRAADTALAAAKSQGRGRALRYRPEMEAERKQRKAVETALRTALVEDGFRLEFQPLFATATKKLCGFEALLRLRDADGQPIRPDIFIPVAEHVGLIEKIGAWVLQRACETAQTWPDDLMVAVNLSPAQFGQDDLVDRVDAVLKQTGLAPNRLELEITESLLIDDADAVLDELTALKRLGVSVALDDFGTGYSSLGYLWQFPFDKLKVDKSFMRDLTSECGKSREILSTIIALGHVLDLTITAEGVETQEQVAILESLNCTLLQGFLLGRPMPESAIEAAIAASRRLAKQVA